MSLRGWPDRRRDRFIGTFLALCTVSAVAASPGSVSRLEPAETRWADNGDLEGWRIVGAGGADRELIEAGEALLSLGVYAGDRDLGEAVDWRPVPPAEGRIAAFVGTHAGLGIEIHRQYGEGAEPGTLAHELHLTARDGNLPADLHLPADFRLELRLGAALRKHAPNDGSLGDAFYGYTRWLAADAAEGEFSPVREAREAASVASVVRHRALIVTAAGGPAWTVDPETGASLGFAGDDLGVPHGQVLAVLELERSAVADTRYRGLMYSDMWAPLRALARLIERVLEVLTGMVGNAGVAVILFALLLRAALMPLGLWSIRQQRHFAEVQRQMKPKIEHINKTMKGAAKSERILETYKEFGISPFSGLKGSTGLFVQLPILIALFAVTTESALFRDVPLLWAPDLSLPDRLAALPFSIVGLGAYVNVLPILLGAVCVAAALVQARSAAGSSPRSGLILALIFVVFFYSCAAALVMYWLVVNVSQIFEGMYVARNRKTP